MCYTITIITNRIRVTKIKTCFWGTYIWFTFTIMYNLTCRTKLITSCLIWAIPCIPIWSFCCFLLARFSIVSTTIFCWSTITSLPIFLTSRITFITMIISITYKWTLYCTWTTCYTCFWMSWWRPYASILCLCKHSFYPTWILWSRSTTCVLCSCTRNINYILYFDINHLDTHHSL